MDVEHPQGVTEHEYANPDHQNGARHRAKGKEGTKPTEQTAKQGVSNKLGDQEQENGKRRGIASQRFLFLFTLTFITSAFKIIMIDLMSQ
jgi:hypothetical protein